MVKELKKCREERIDNLKGGEGHVTFLHFYEPEDFYGVGRLYGITLVEPGNSIGLHGHDGEQESYYIIRGKALYNDNGQEMEIGPGTLTLCKSGEVHAIKNIGDDTLEYAMLITNTN